MNLEQLNKAIHNERQRHGLTGRLEDLIRQRNNLIKKARRYNTNVSSSSQ